VQQILYIPDIILSRRQQCQSTEGNRLHKCHTKWFISWDIFVAWL